jgi:hypothetical protein
MVKVRSVTWLLYDVLNDQSCSNTLYSKLIHTQCKTSMSSSILYVSHTNLILLPLVNTLHCPWWTATHVIQFYYQQIQTHLIYLKYHYIAIPLKYASAK